MRFIRPKRILELGTAYGMSSFLMGQKLDCLLDTWSITTVEVDARIHPVASSLLQGAFGKRVSCLLGNSRDVLGQFRASQASFDFLFHDADHSFDAYVSDFEAAEPMLMPGAALLIDDIRWEDERFHVEAPRTYEGWRRIVEHPRVVMAVELDQCVGLAILR